MTYLSKEQILGANDLIYEDVAVPEWGGVVRVRGLTGIERDELEAAQAERQKNRVTVKIADFRARLVALSVVDEAGARLFSDRDVKALGAKSATALQRVFDVALRLAGLTPGDVEELTENFE